MIRQKWEGYVTHIDLFADEFRAVIQDITDPDMPDEMVTFRISDMPERDQDKLAIGLIFNWTIEVDEKGIGRSTMRFSNEKWTAEELARINEEAKKLHSLWNPDSI